MTGEVMHVGDDLRHAASFVRDTLGPALSSFDWTRPAGATDWSCRDTVDHVANALCGYGVSLANRRSERLPHHPRNGDASASPAHLLGIMAAFADVLAVVAEAAPPGQRAFHPAGMADRDGFVAMGCDELLVHGHDIASSLGIAYAPPADLAARVRTRLFPWAPTDGEAWRALLWANGRIALADRERLGPDWWWHCAPLGEWDGEVQRRSVLDPPGWR